VVIVNLLEIIHIVFLCRLFLLAYFLCVGVIIIIIIIIIIMFFNQFYKAIKISVLFLIYFRLSM